MFALSVLPFVFLSQFLRDVLDTLFCLLDDNTDKYGPLVFQSLVGKLKQHIYTLIYNLFCLRADEISMTSTCVCVRVCVCVCVLLGLHHKPAQGQPFLPLSTRHGLLHSEQLCRSFGLQVHLLDCFTFKAFISSSE